VLPELARGGGVFPIASVHVLPRLSQLYTCSGRPGCRGAVASLRRRWVDAVADRLRRVSGRNYSRAVIAGDFNAVAGQPFHNSLSRKGFHRVSPDIVTRNDHHQTIDFIFTRGRGLRASFDHRGRGGSHEFPLGYSDHRFLWAGIR
jgi:endonuclease/exonuclease/phosphatase (EEP) superfamily protein YafD